MGDVQYNNTIREPRLKEYKAIAERVLSDAVTLYLDADDTEGLERLAQLVFRESSRQVANEQTACFRKERVRS